VAGSFSGFTAPQLSQVILTIARLVKDLLHEMQAASRRGS